MTDDRRNLVRAKINLELSDYRKNGDRRHLGLIAEMMAEHIGTPDAGEEIKAIMLSEKTLPKLQATVGTEKQLEDGLIRYFWREWKGKRPNQEIYSEIKNILIQNNLPWKLDTEERLRKRIERMNFEQVDNP